MLAARRTADYQSLRAPSAETCADAGPLARQPWVVDGVLVTVDDLDAHHAPSRRRGSDGDSSGTRISPVRSVCTRPGPDREGHIAGSVPAGDDAGALPHEPRPRSLRRSLRAPALARRRRLAGRDPRHRVCSSSTRRWSRIGRRTERRRAPRPRRRRRRDRRDRPRRQVDLPRPGPARLLPDPRPRPARQGRQALRAATSRRRSSARWRRSSSKATRDRGPDRRLVPSTAPPRKIASHRRARHAAG